MSAPIAPSASLGPATVVAVDGGLRVRLEDGAEVPAEVALTFPYTPSLGDELLVIGEASERFVIGVLGAAAPTSLDLGEEGGVHATGVLTVASETQLEAEAPRIGLRARALRTFASTLEERVDEASSWVRNLLTVRARASRRLVTGADTTQAGRSVTLATGKVKLDADTIDMGS